MQGRRADAEHIAAIQQTVRLRSTRLCVELNSLTVCTGYSSIKLVQTSADLKSSSGNFRMHAMPFSMISTTLAPYSINTPASSSG